MPPTSVDIAIMGQCDVVLLLQLISRDMIRGSVGLTTMPQQEQPQFHKPVKAYANYVMGSHVSFFFQNWSSHLLHYVCNFMVFTFCFQIPMWLPYSPMVAQPLQLAAPQLFRVYPWQAYVLPCAGPWQLPRVHHVLLRPLFSVGGASCYSFSCFSAIQSMW